MIKIIATDFDGVLVESNKVKEFTAWDELLRTAGFAPPELFWRARERVGKEGTRYDILRAVFSEIGTDGRSIEPLVQEYAERYNAIVQDALGREGLAPGAAGAIQRLTEKYPLYIISATPEQALRQSVEQLGIIDFFTGVCGAPMSKKDHLRSIFQSSSVSPDEVIFIGDDERDWVAAEEAGCGFVGIPNEFNRWQPDEKRFPLIPSFAGLESFLLDLA